MSSGVLLITRDTRPVELTCPTTEAMTRRAGTVESRSSVAVDQFPVPYRTRLQHVEAGWVVVYHLSCYSAHTLHRQTVDYHVVGCLHEPDDERMRTSFMISCPDGTSFTLSEAIRRCVDAACCYMFSRQSPSI